jgi:hypothetical protein
MTARDGTGRSRRPVRPYQRASRTISRGHRPRSSPTCGNSPGSLVSATQLNTATCSDDRSRKGRTQVYDIPITSIDLVEGLKPEDLVVVFLATFGHVVARKGKERRHSLLRKQHHTYFAVRLYRAHGRAQRSLPTRSARSSAGPPRTLALPLFSAGGGWLCPT